MKTLEELLWELIGKETKAMRSKSLKNMTMEIFEREVGKFLGGKLIIKVIFDERNIKD